MNLLVTGHKGFIGQNCVRFMEGCGHNVRGYEWGDGEYSLEDIDWVIHLGAISHTTYSDVRQLLIQNYYFTVELIERCNAQGIPLQFASSASVYGIDNQTFKETDIPSPRNYYAWSKWSIEEYIKSKSFNVPIQAFRYFNVHGPCEEHKGDQASPHHKFTVQAREYGVIKLFEGSGKFKRDFIHVDQILNLQKRFLNVKESGIWNFGTGMATSFETVADSIATAYNSKIEYIPMPENLKNSYQAFTKADMTHTFNTLKKYEA